MSAQFSVNQTSTAAGTTTTTTKQQPTKGGPPKPGEGVWHTKNSQGGVHIEEVRNDAEFRPEGDQAPKSSKPGKKHIRTVRRTRWFGSRRRHDYDDDDDDSSSSSSSSDDSSFMTSFSDYLADRTSCYKASTTFILCFLLFLKGLGVAAVGFAGIAVCKVTIFIPIWEGVQGIVFMLIMVTYAIMLAAVLSVSCGRRINRYEFRHSFRQMKPTYVYIFFLGISIIVLMVFLFLWQILGIVIVIIFAGKISTSETSSDYCAPWFFWFVVWKLVLTIIIGIIWVLSFTAGWFLQIMLPPVLQEEDLDPDSCDEFDSPRVRHV